MLPDIGSRKDNENAARAHLLIEKHNDAGRPVILSQESESDVLNSGRSSKRKRDIISGLSQIGANDSNPGEKGS